MTETPRVLSLASAAALLLALSHPGLASPETAAVGAPVAAGASQVGPAPAAAPAAPAQAPAAAPPAPVAEATAPAPEAATPGPEPAAAEAPAAEPAAAPAAAPAAPPTPGEAVRAQAEARRAELDAERNQRYQELRKRAAEVGLELPETPPWEAMPQMPGMPGQAGVAAPDWDAMRAEREAMRERFKAMTPEERKAMRDAHWQTMRERAAARGVEMPETPPWEEAEKRYKAAQEQFDRYRKIVDEMTEEQLEAARALFGRGEGPSQPMMPPQMPQMPQQMPPMPPQGYGYGPGGGYPGYGPYKGGPGGMGRMPVPLYEGGMEQGPPPPQGSMPY